MTAPGGSMLTRGAEWFRSPPGKSLLSCAALLYLVLLPLHIPIRGPLYLQDALAPFFVLAVFLRFRSSAARQTSLRLLGAFLVLATLTTAWHLDSAADAYELAIFAYMALIFLLFREVRLPDRWLLLYAAGVAAVFLVHAVAGLAAGGYAAHTAYEGTTLGFLSRRFSFRFPNPNLLGSYYVLPMACGLLGLRGWYARLKPGRRDVLVAGVAAAFVPLLLSVSRHMILSLALLAGYAASEVLPGNAARWRRLGLAAVAGAFCLFYATLVVPFFPLERTFPFVNCRTPGMYTIHQEIYLKLAVSNARFFLLGPGRTESRRLYPQVADREAIRKILAEYRMDHLTDTFATYLDAHNEYLNTATSFGVPAMLVLAGFFGSLAVQGWRNRRTEGALLLFFVAGLLAAAFWDDILSKRWIWATAGILAAAAGPRELSDATAAGEPADVLTA